MQLGLIGAGRIGTLHAGILTAIPAIQSLLIADAVAGRATDLAAVHDGAAAVSIDEVFASPVDGVIIASSTDSHAALLERAAAAGKPTFCEKPIATDLTGTRRAVAAVEEAGIPVQMGFQRRYDPAMRSIRDRVASGGLGKVYLIRSQTHDPEPPPMDYIPVSGGIFKDCLVHDIDIVRYVTGQEVVSVRTAGAAIGFPEIGELGDVDSATAILEFSEGTLGQLSGLRHDPLGYDVRLEVFGSLDSVAAGWGPRTPIRSADPGAPELTDPMVSWLDRFGAAYTAELEGFIRVVLGDEVPAATARDAYEDLRVATACDLSLTEDRTVYLEEIE